MNQHYTRPRGPGSGGGGSPVSLPQLFADKFSFGPTPQLVAEIEAETPYAWLDRQLAWQSIPEDGWLEATLATFRTRGLVGPQRQVEESRNKMPLELRTATLLRAVYSPRHLHEVLVEFWNDHFNLAFESGIMNMTMQAADTDVARTHATGRFHDLLHASARSVAMLSYLDNDRSRAPHPNENYARELLELHTLGVDGGYTEADVKQAALALSGWSRTPHNAEDPLFSFLFKDRDHHAEGPIQFLDLAMPAMSGPAAIAHGETLLTFLAAHPSTAIHVCTKLARRFVSDDPSAGLVRDLTDAWFASDGSIAAVIRALARHPEFHASSGRKSVRPFGALAGMLRRLGDSIHIAAEDGADAPVAGKLDGLLNRMGQRPFQWPAPNGYPDVGGYWVSTGGLMGRWNAALAIVADRHEGLIFHSGVLRQQVDAPTLAELVTNLSLRLAGRPPTTAETAAALDLAAVPADTSAREIPDQLFRALVALALSTPALQRR